MTRGTCSPTRPKSWEYKRVGVAPSPEANRGVTSKRFWKFICKSAFQSLLIAKQAFTSIPFCHVGLVAHTRPILGEGNCPPPPPPHITLQLSDHRQSGREMSRLTGEHGIHQMTLLSLSINIIDDSSGCDNY